MRKFLENQDDISDAKLALDLAKTDAELAKWAREYGAAALEKLRDIFRDDW